MRSLLLTLIIFGAIPYIFMRPHIGVLVWSWIGYMNPHRLTYGFAYSMPFVAIIAGITIVSILFSKEKKTFPVSGITVVWLVFVFWCCGVTYFFAINPDGAATEVDRMIKIQIMVLSTLLVINSKERIIQLVWVLVVSIGFFGVKGGLFALKTGFNYRISGPPDSFIGPNNEMALALLMIIPLIYFLFKVSENKWVKRGLMISMLLCFFAVISSYSRGAFLGMAVMMFFLWLGLKHKILIGGIVFAIIIAGIPFIPQQWFDRMNTIETYDEDESAMGRVNSWYMAFNLANDNPVLGGGFRAFTPEAFQKYAPEPDTVFDAHSIYFEVLAEQGYVGLFLFMLLWALVFLEVIKIKRLAKKNDELAWMVDLLYMTQVGLIAYMVTGAFLGLAYFDLPYHFMAIVVITSSIYRKSVKEKECDLAQSAVSSAR